MRRTTKNITIYKLGAFIIMLLLLVAPNINAETTLYRQSVDRGTLDDSYITVLSDTTSYTDSTNERVFETQADSSQFVPDPTKALWYSAIAPGVGQIYTRRYWKLPLLFGGVAGVIYGISFNTRYYNDYTNAYRDIYSNDPNANSYINFLPYAYRDDTEWIENNKDWIKSALKSKKDYYRKYRDICIAGMVGIYALAMIDAYVDAQLYNFDISPDVSLQISPAVLEPTLFTQTALGLQCSIKF